MKNFNFIQNEPIEMQPVNKETFKFNLIIELNLKMRQHHNVS